MTGYSHIRVRADAVILVIGGGFTTPTPARELGQADGWPSAPDKTVMVLIVENRMETPHMVSGTLGGFTLVAAREDLAPPRAAPPPPDPA
jgi:hypothetical protein